MASMDRDYDARVQYGGDKALEEAHAKGMAHALGIAREVWQAALVKQGWQEERNVEASRQTAQRARGAWSVVVAIEAAMAVGDWE